MAIRTFEPLGLSRGRIAPLMYRLLIRFKPDLPPPLFNSGRFFYLASTAIYALLLLAPITGIWLQTSRNLPTEKLSYFLIAFLIIFPIAIAVAFFISSTLRTIYEQDRLDFKLPEWNSFSANWQPNTETIIVTQQHTHYWFLSTFTSTTGLLCFSASLLIYYGLPYLLKRETMGYLLAVATGFWLLCSIYGFYRSTKSEADKPPSQLWNAVYGTLTGFILLAPTTEITYLVILGSGFAWELCDRYRLSTLAARQLQANLQHARNEARLSALKSQLEPHFIFNTLAHLRRLITEDPQRAATLTDDLALLMRNSLTALRTDWVPLDEEITLIQHYLDVVKVRLGERLTYTINLSPEVSEAGIPPLILLTLIENAVRHGIEPKPGGGCIDISAGKEQDLHGAWLVLKIADTGMGFSSSVGGSGVGLTNIRERLTLLYGGRADLKLRANVPDGVIAEIKLPL